MTQCGADAEDSAAGGGVDWRNRPRYGIKTSGHASACPWSALRSVINRTQRLSWPAASYGELTASLQPAVEPVVGALAHFVGELVAGGGDEELEGVGLAEAAVEHAGARDDLFGP
jgi:hypothetical protein